MSKETGLDFASKVDGRMYSCGHDAHTAMLATAAHLLCSHRARLKGNVEFMFQPGGEGARLTNEVQFLYDRELQWEQNIITSI